MHVLAVGPNLSSLSSVAVAGGTNEAMLIETAEVQSGVSEALVTLRDAAARCVFPLSSPDAGALDPSRVNVVVDDRVLYNVIRADCEQTPGGWYYDHPTDPTRIMLCPDICAALPGPLPEVQIEHGCAMFRSP